MSVLAAGMVWALRLAFRPDPFSPASAALVAFSIVATSLVAAAGIAISHGRWSRRLALGLVGTEAILAAAMPLDGWGWVGIGSVGVAMIALTGPWLDGWLRRRPAAGGPAPAPMLVAIGAVVLPGVVGAAVPDEVTAGHWALAAAGLVLGFGFARAQGWGLWGIRLALPAAAVWAAVTSPWPGAVAILAATGAMVAAAWRRESTVAVYPLLETLPGPRRSRPGGAGVAP